MMMKKNLTRKKKNLVGFLELAVPLLVLRVHESVGRVFGPSLLLQALFPVVELKEAGFSAAELRSSGCTFAELHAVKFSRAALIDAGFAPTTDESPIGAGWNTSGRGDGEVHRAIFN